MYTPSPFPVAILVSLGQLLRRINGWIASRHMRLCAAHGQADEHLGAYYLTSLTGHVLKTDVDIEAYARFLGLLAPWEAADSD